MKVLGRDIDLGRALGKAPKVRMSVYDFEFEGTDVVEDIRSKYDYDGELSHIFSGNTGSVVHKWHHYIPIYDTYFSRFRGTDFKFLEIGVSHGGSMRMWRKYFGPDATIFGVDINESCRKYDGEAGQVRIGSQDDPAFLQSVLDEMGRVDAILDDGSHCMPHIRRSLQILFPHLAENGIYMIEDLHTAYWPVYGGGYGKPANFFRDLGQIIDDMHACYHEQGLTWPGVGDAVSAMHIHDSIAVLEKGPVHRPVHSQVGTS